PCFFAPTDSEGSIPDPIDSEVDTDIYEPDTAVPLTAASPGDLVITEFMVQPSDCSPEYRAEYVEVYNASANHLDLRYLEVAVGFQVATIFSRTVIAPQQYAVLYNGRTGDGQFCYPQVPLAGKF